MCSEHSTALGIGRKAPYNAPRQPLYPSGWTKRVEGRAQMAARAVGRDEFEDCGLLLRERVVRGSIAHRECGTRPGLCGLLDAFHRRRMRDIGFVAFEPVEIRFPVRTHTGRIGEIVFVKVFDERGVAAGVLRSRGKLLDQAIHSSAPGVRFGLQVIDI